MSCVGTRFQVMRESSCRHRRSSHGRRLAVSEVPVVSRADFSGTGFSQAHQQGVREVSWHLPSSIPLLVRGLLKAGEPFVYAYYEGVDKIAHATGLGELYGAELNFADSAGFPNLVGAPRRRRARHHCRPWPSGHRSPGRCGRAGSRSGKPCDERRIAVSLASQLARAGRHPHGPRRGAAMAQRHGWRPATRWSARGSWVASPAKKPWRAWEMCCSCLWGTTLTWTRRTRAKPSSFRATGA